MYTTLVASIEGTNITGEEKLRERISEVYGDVVGFEGKPTQSQIDMISTLKKELQDAEKKGNDIMEKDLAVFNKTLSGSKLENIPVPDRAAFDKKTKKN